MDVLPAGSLTSSVTEHVTTPLVIGTEGTVSTPLALAQWAEEEAGPGPS